MLKIAIANSRLSKKWKNVEMTPEEFIERLSNTTRTDETVEQFSKMSKDERSNIKDVGGFVGGHLEGGIRKVGNVQCRSLICLDIDYADGDTIDDIEMLTDFKCVIYSTHSHTPEKPRLRLVVFLSRDISEEEYEPTARMVASEIGMNLFDDSTYEANRLMYWPSTSKDGEYVFRSFEGALFDPDVYLAKYDDWHDISSWPKSSRQVEVIRKTVDKAKDPTEKGGIIGVFCRAYGISDVMEEFLGDVYKPSAIEGRYDYIPASSCGGVIVYDDTFAYSHHATDPACNKCLNAFDLVRVHKFGHLDDDAEPNTPITRMPSFLAMCDFAYKDEGVILLMDDERLEDAKQFDVLVEDADWRLKLKRDKHDQILELTYNYALIIKNDEAFKSVVFNEFKSCVDVIGSLPWKQVKPGFNDSDLANARMYIERCYGLYSHQKFKDALLGVTSSQKLYHPVKNYLESLNWDGVPRVENLLIEYLGAEDDDYTRAVTRKTLCAAVARIYQPGIKFDSILVLDGKQGIGKSTIFARLGGDWFSDSLSLADIKDKTSAEKLQGYWIMEIPELSGLKKIELEQTKAFITRTDDKFRQAYGTIVESHPRSCIIIGTTNNSEYLRDNTGNRRFYPVHCSGDGTKKPWQLTKEDVGQIWAEAKVYYEQGEELFLKDGVAQKAAEYQREAMEQDPRQGIVEEYLNMLLPDNWADMDLYERRNYIHSYSEGKGKVPRERVCGLEIWCECFDKQPENFKKSDAFEIIGILEKIDSWSRYEGNKSGKMKFKHYGSQRAYILVANSGCQL